MSNHEAQQPRALAKQLAEVTKLSSVADLAWPIVKPTCRHLLTVARSRDIVHKGDGLGKLLDTFYRWARSKRTIFSMSETVDALVSSAVLAQAGTSVSRLAQCF